MRTRVSAALALALPLVLLGCPLGHQSAGARAQEAASELNLNARFGRMELAAEHVAPKAREGFFQRRRAWGNLIRVADYELAGLKLAKTERHADLFVRVAWYRVDEGDLHSTMLRQKWEDMKGDWKLVSEERLDGDVGLLGEAAPHPAAPRPAPRNAQFPTIRLGQGEPAPAPAQAAQPEAAPPSAAPAQPAAAAPSAATTAAP